MPDTALSQGGDPLVARLLRLESNQVSDVLDEAGLPNQVLSSALRGLHSTTRCGGRAACASGEPYLASTNPVPALPGDTLEQLTGADRVLVVGTGGYIGSAVLGGFVALSLKSIGCRGFLTDGAIRDAAEITELQLPVVCSTVTPINSAHRWRLTRRDVPVFLPGQSGAPVEVNPGDLILADGDGVVVIPATAAEQIVADTEQLRLIEKRIGDELRAGAGRVETMKKHPRFAHIRKVSLS